eukprot:765407-Hanusia_phi.AAC.5
MQAGTCDQTERCVNTEGSFVCLCKEGRRRPVGRCGLISCQASSRTPRPLRGPARLVLPPTRPPPSVRPRARHARRATTATQAAAAARALRGRRQVQGASS